MKPGESSLNPYAASYVPLFKRGALNVNNEFTPGHDFNRGNEVVRLGHQQNNNSLPHAGEFFASTSQYPNDVEFELDLADLQMTFPGISDEFLYDVYLANRCDLEAAVDMLNQMESCPDDLRDKLPDTLGIGDVPESLSNDEASQKVDNPASETEASTPGSSNIFSAS